MIHPRSLAPSATSPTSVYIAPWRPSTWRVRITDQLSITGDVACVWLQVVRLPPPMSTRFKFQLGNQGSDWPKISRENLQLNQLKEPNLKHCINFVARKSRIAWLHRSSANSSAILVRSLPRVGPGSFLVSSRTVAQRVLCWLFHCGHALSSSVIFTIVLCGAGCM